MGCVSSSTHKKVVSELEEKTTDLQQELDQQKELNAQNTRQIDTLTEAAEVSSAKIADLQTELTELALSTERAVSLKKEWQLQAASAAAKLEKYRDRYDIMIQANRLELETRVRHEIDLEIKKKEISTEAELMAEKEKRLAYERILLNLGYTSGLLPSASGALDASKPSRRDSLPGGVQNSFVARIPPPVATQTAAEAADPPTGEAPGSMWKSILGRAKKELAN